MACSAGKRGSRWDTEVGRYVCMYLGKSEYLNGDEASALGSNGKRRRTLADRQAELTEALHWLSKQQFLLGPTTLRGQRSVSDLLGPSVQRLPGVEPEAFLLYYMLQTVAFGACHHRCPTPHARTLQYYTHLSIVTRLLHQHRLTTVPLMICGGQDMRTHSRMAAGMQRLLENEGAHSRARTPE